MRGEIRILLMWLISLVRLVFVPSMSGVSGVSGSVMEWSLARRGGVRLCYVVF